MYGNKKATKKLFRDYVVLPLNKEEKKKFKKKFQNSIQGASAWYSMYLAKVTLTPKAEQSTIHFFDGKDMLGNTPLHLASYMGFEKCAALLLKNGKYTPLFGDAGNNFFKSTQERILKLQTTKDGYAKS